MHCQIHQFTLILYGLEVRCDVDIFKLTACAHSIYRDVDGRAHTEQTLFCRAPTENALFCRVVVVLVVVVVVVGQTVGAISSQMLAYDCLYTLELCTTSMIATS